MLIFTHVPALVTKICRDTFLWFPRNGMNEFGEKLPNSFHGKYKKLRILSAI